MAIRFQCQCGKALAAADGTEGRQVKCPACQRVLTIPRAPGAPAGAAWYVGRGGQQTGPFSQDALRAMVARGEVGPEDVVWKEGMADWVPASYVPELGPPAPGAMPGRSPAAFAHEPLGPPAPSVPSPGAGEDEAATTGTSGLMWVGVLLLAGFLLPVVVPAQDGMRVVFPNLLILGERRVPALAQFMSLYPCLAGIAVLVLAYAARGIGRSIALMGMGVLPFLLLLADAGVRGSMGHLAWGLGLFAGVTALFGYLGTVGVFAGARARSLCPWSQPAAVVGAIGGGLHLLSLLLPTGGEWWRLNSMGIIQPFQLLGDPGTLTIGIVAVVAMGLAIAASIVCLVNARQRANAESLARTAFWLLLAGLLASIVGVGSIGAFHGARQVGGAIPAIIFGLLTALKMACWTLGLLLLTPLGLADLLLHIRPAAPESRGS